MMWVSLKRILVANALITLSIIRLDAAETGASLDLLLSKAVTDHPSILQRLSENEAARSESEVARWQRYPTINVSASEASADISQANTSF